MATIFLVDDDLASELIVDNLRYRGHSVERVSSINEALQNAERIARSDLVILDLIMPGSSDRSATAPDGERCTGMLVYRELRQRRTDLPILVFTANQDPSPIGVIEVDPHAKYISRWSSPKLQELVAIMHQMIGIDPTPPIPRPFIVHGHDTKTKLEVKNYIQNTLGLPEPIILREEPSLGRTLIEKFEELAVGVELVFVLLTPDDLPATPTDGDVEKRRARQNVILELGFFLGALGRRSGRVFLLYKGPLELPSDLSGVVYLDIGLGVEAVGEQIRKEIDAIRRQNATGKRYRG